MRPLHRILLILISGPLIAFWGASCDRRSSPPTASEAPPTTFVTPAAHREKLALQQQLAPNETGWASEHLAEILHHRLIALLARPTETQALQEFAVADISVTPILDDSLQETYRSDAVHIRQLKGAVHPQSGLTALKALLKPLTPDLHPTAKIIGIQTRPGRAETTVRIEGDSPERQIRAQWQCEWTLQDPEAPRLTTVRCESFQEARSNHEPWFHDRTGAVVGDHEQLEVGLDTWLTKIERTHGMRYFSRTGLAVADVNADGLDDLYVCQAGGLPNLLFIQTEAGGTIDISRQAGVAWLDHTSSALFVDLDNDGDQDLALATFEGVLVLEQHAPMKFQRRALLSTKDTDLQSLSAVDVDGDALLDLYLCVDFADSHSRRDEATTAFIYHDANDGGENQLWRNAITGPGDWQFINVTEATGLNVNNRRHSLAAAWEDVDNDGDQDLYVANDYGQNCLYQNNEGRFKDIASAAGVVDYGSGMSASWGDANRDGFMDLYVGNMFSSAGSRLSAQAQFLDQSPPEVRALYQRFSKGNSLFVNGQGSTFDDVSMPSGVAMGRWAWSSLFADVNNDSWDDLLVSNGYITTEDTGDL